MVIEAEGVNVEEMKRGLEVYLKSYVGHAVTVYSDVYIPSVKVSCLRTEEIRDWGLTSDRETYYPINGYLPDDEGIRPDELIRGNS